MPDQLQQALIARQPQLGMLRGAQTIQAAPPGDIDPSEIMRGEMPVLVGSGGLIENGFSNLLNVGKGALGGIQEALGFGGTDSSGRPSAVHKGFQEDGQGGGFDLYDIQGGPSDGSTVSRGTLEKMGIPVPSHPNLSTAIPEQMQHGVMRSEPLPRKSVAPEVETLGSVADRGGMFDPKYAAWMKEVQAKVPTMEALGRQLKPAGGAPYAGVTRMPVQGGALHEVLMRAAEKSGAGLSNTPGEARLLEHFMKLIR